MRIWIWEHWVKVTKLIKFKVQTKKWGPHYEVFLGNKILPWPRLLSRVHWTHCNHNLTSSLWNDQSRPINQFFDRRVVSLVTFCSQRWRFRSKSSLIRYISGLKLLKNYQNESSAIQWNIWKPLMKILKCIARIPISS